MWELRGEQRWPQIRRAAKEVEGTCDSLQSPRVGFDSDRISVFLF